MAKLPSHHNYLWIARKKAGMGQKSVARLLGYRSVSPVSEYETGRLLPSLRSAFKLSVLYNMPLTELYAPLHKEVEAELEARKGRSASLPRTRPDQVTNL